jgi:nitrilase
MIALRGDTMTKIAVVQRPPVLLNRDKTLAAAVDALREASREGAQLVVFPEAYVPGYPIWIWRLRPGGDASLVETLHAALLANAVELERDDLAPLRDAAREAKVTVVVGVDEIDSAGSRSTIYNTVVTIGPDGRLLNRHRKVMPTNPERMVWGFGDASGLRGIDTDCGRIGALICWENYMPLARAALYAQGVDIYLAPTYDCGDRWVASMQHIAREGGCWVAGSGFALRARDLPADLPGRAQMYPDADEWINAGDSTIVAPGGKIVAGPLRNEYGIVYADVDVGRARAARRTLDTVGHYARPDLFRLAVDRNPQQPVTFEDPPRPMS